MNDQEAARRFVASCGWQKQAPQDPNAEPQTRRLLRLERLLRSTCEAFRDLSIEHRRMAAELDAMRLRVDALEAGQVRAHAASKVAT
jgi:hypothetical protein